MPYKPLRPCNHPGCRELTRERFCEKHRKEREREKDKGRPTAAQRGYDSRWRKARTWYLKRNPLCVECEKKGKLTPATVIDHVVPHRGDKELFWDMSNWQALCKPCHDRKTAKEDGGFGNG